MQKLNDALAFSIVQIFNIFCKIYSALDSLLLLLVATNTEPIISAAPIPCIKFIFSFNINILAVIVIIGIRFKKILQITRLICLIAIL